MEIKQAGPLGPEHLAKIERARLDALSSQAFSQLVEDIGEAAAVKKAAETAPPAAAFAEPPAMPQVNDEAASNYWQVLRLTMNAEGDPEEASEDETDRKKKKRRRNRRP
jgi:NTP pyrophosphatase (non-canonical NTP hydrolase)